ncbi:hypothetical protein HF576_05710 [Microbacterium sp. CFH 90308]|uniref:Uncharacterized protein n=1 Tax=Microbacterium salsuginis TaxID=2722803 RepID=A0ABX1KB99_9MICO|nr:hypothetical protein [Microbacterium sp. CFH 90308]NLP83334.1 hypothetical protein [Microbacterium sp. CFH 90308]
MTAPWLARRSKTDDLEAIVALCAVGLHFVVGVVLAFVVVYSDEWLIECYVVACGIPSVSIAIYGFLILDILLFLVAWGLSFILGSKGKGWWRVCPPLAGIVIAVLTAAIALYWVLASGS